MANIQDVAREAGCSTATVSRAYNYPEKVLPKTLLKIHDAAERLDYNSAENRRRYSYNNSHTVLVIMPDFNNIFLIDVLSGINEAAMKNDYSILLFASNSNIERERETMKLLNKRQADGVIILSSILSDDDLENIAKNYPLVQCCEYSASSHLPHVSINNYTVAQEACEFLIKLGYKDIAMLTSNHGYISTSLREEGFRDCLKAHHLSIPSNWIRKGSTSFIGGYEGMQALMKCASRPRAVLCNSDNIAAGAIRMLQEAGLRVPEDVAIMGIDNLELCVMVTPTLTTMSQPRKRIGKTAFHMFLRQISGETDQQSLFLPHELIVRNST